MQVELKRLLLSLCTSGRFTNPQTFYALIPNWAPAERKNQHDADEFMRFLLKELNVAPSLTEKSTLTCSSCQQASTTETLSLPILDLPLTSAASSVVFVFCDGCHLLYRSKAGRIFQNKKDETAFIKKKDRLT
jgi:hypothetical protein